jgi:hypothetical protein
MSLRLTKIGELDGLVSILEYHLIKFSHGRTSFSSPYPFSSSVNSLSPKALPFSSSPSSQIPCPLPSYTQKALAHPARLTPAATYQAAPTTPPFHTRPKSPPTHYRSRSPGRCRHTLAKPMYSPQHTRIRATVIQQYNARGKCECSRCNVKQKNERDPTLDQGS